MHPEHALRGIDFSTGSLGQGLSIGAGAALAARLQGSARRVFVLVSDAECNEGSLWEAVMFAAHHRLANLVAIVDLNGQQALGYTEQVLVAVAAWRTRWRAFGWDVHEVDGHDVAGDGRHASPALDTARRPRRTCSWRARSSARASPTWKARSSGTTGRCRTRSTGRPSRRSMRPAPMQACGGRSSRTLVELAEADPRILLLTGDLGYMALEPFAERFPTRFFNVGVAEQNMVGMATGLAEAGFIPFVYSIVTFATLRPYELGTRGPPSKPVSSLSTATSAALRARRAA